MARYEPAIQRIIGCHIVELAFMYYDGLNLKANFQDCYFSDREYSNSRRNRLPFNPNAPYKHSYILTPDGRLITTLNSWGNHTYTHLLTCTASGIHYFGDHSGLIIFKKDCTRR